MCGFCGILSSNKNIDVNQLLSMTRVLRHRGPDDEGFFLGNSYTNVNESFHHDETIESIKLKTQRLKNNFNANLGIGFRRLSILDLSENGHQPMQFEEAELWIVFNGEIYNYIELRDELRQYGYSFKSNTDTEVILKAYHLWGEDCVHKFNGMWAFAIWDSKNNKLFCSRDRFGVKPFYYHFNPQKQFIFASELKSILQIIRTRPNRQAFYDAFAGGYSDHNENTFFEDIKQLRGGHNLIFRNGEIAIYQYYKINSKRTNDSFEKAKTKISELLFDAVKIRLRSDVPLGFALSGGIDSSSIVGIASKHNSGSNNTFSMIYPGEKLDESFFIKKVIEKTGVNHHFVTPTSDDFSSELEKFIWHQEEPFFGTSYFGEFKLRELIRKNGVTVSLEGQGADEIITGYSSLLYPYYFDLISNFKFKQLLKELKLFANYESSLLRIIKAYFSRNANDTSNYLTAKYPYINLDYFEGVNFSKNIQNEFKSDSYLNDKLYEMLVYTSLPQQLIRADKSSMAFSVECRFPFLDYRFVEYAINLPFNYKIKNGVTKHILREAMRDFLPEEVYLRRDKIGFAIPDEKFNKSENPDHILQRISDSNLSSFKILDKDKFIKLYKKENQELDWKFWKTVSVLLWYITFFSNPSE